MSTPDEVAADLLKLADTTFTAVVRAVDREGVALMADVKKRASRDRNLPSVAGEPPRLQTGDYNRSINKRTTVSGRKVTTSVGTDKAQGFRLENGFDAPGQRTLPHPHFGPALDEAQPHVVEAIQRAIGDAAR